MVELFHLLAWRVNHKQRISSYIMTTSSFLWSERKWRQHLRDVSVLFCFETVPCADNNEMNPIRPSAQETPEMPGQQLVVWFSDLKH